MTAPDMTRLGDVIGGPPPEVQVLCDTQRSWGEACAESQDWTVVGGFEDLDITAIKLSPWEPTRRSSGPSTRRLDRSATSEVRSKGLPPPTPRPGLSACHA